MGEAKPELLPCPFCGGEAREDAHADDCYFVLHRKLNEQPEADMSLHLEVLDAWNRRSGQLVERVKELEGVVRAGHSDIDGMPFGDLLAAANVLRNNGYSRLAERLEFKHESEIAAISKARPNTAEGEAPSEADREELEAVIACLGDDAATLREQNPECEMAANMDRAAELLAAAKEPSP